MSKPLPDFVGDEKPVTQYDSFDEALSRLAMWEEVAAEIAGVLDALGCCCHGPHGDKGATPPMNFPDWIRCVVAKRERRIAELGHDAYTEAAIALAERIARGWHDFCPACGMESSAGRQPHWKGCELAAFLAAKAAKETP